MKLVQTQNPQIFLKIKDWWHKYMSKIRNEVYESEVLRLAECFRPDGEGRFFVLCDEKGEMHGFATVMMDRVYDMLFVMQVATDSPQKMRDALRELAKKAGALDVYFITERSPRAWNKLLGSRTTGYVINLGLGG